MFNANLELNLGKKSKEYIKILDKKISYKRSTVSLVRKGDIISVKVIALDSIALIASLSSVLKQVRIIGNADKLFDSD